MTGVQCVHGMDSRFCAICNRATRGAGARGAGSSSSGTSLAEIVEFLNAAHVRATYGAVAELIGVGPRSVGTLLGPRRPEMSWIVNQSTGLPTDYNSAEVHPSLLSRGVIISNGRELALKMSAWKLRRPK